MAIRSVESLREKLRRDTNPLDVLMSFPAKHRFLDGVTVEGYEAALDEIEREVAERFIELPTDMDGEPIHPGDVMRYHEYVFEVKEMTHAEGMWSVSDMSDTVARPCELAHHEPTVEDVLRDYGLAANDLYTRQDIGGDDKAYELEELRKEYAAKLRLAGDEHER